MLRGREAAGHDCKTATEQQKREQGCEAPSPTAEWEFDGIKLDRCPAYYINRARDWLNHVVGLYCWRKHGILARAGGIMDQPNIEIEAIEYIDRLVSIREAQQRKKPINVRRGTLKRGR